jgi:hypothetical protein
MPPLRVSGGDLSTVLEPISSYSTMIFNMLDRSFSSRWGGLAGAARILENERERRDDEPRDFGGIYQAGMGV